MKLSNLVKTALLSTMLMPTVVSADPWNGPYVGARVETWDFGIGTSQGGTVVAGYNTQAGGHTVIGGEVSYLQSFEGMFNELLGTARVGVLVSPVVLAYASLGYGSYEDFITGTSKTVGGGIEFAASDNVTLRLEYAKHSPDDFPFFEGTPAYSAAALWHF